MADMRSEGAHVKTRDLKPDQTMSSVQCQSMSRCHVCHGVSHHLCHHVTVCVIICVTVCALCHSLCHHLCHSVMVWVTLRIMVCIMVDDPVCVTIPCDDSPSAGAGSAGGV